MNGENDIWNPLANLLADLIEKYASELDLENLPSVNDSHISGDDSAKSIEFNKKV
jgi:hypothetical protein